jgi:hypothetical protein
MPSSRSSAWPGHDRGRAPRGEIRLIDAGHVTMHLRHPGAVLQAIEDLRARLADRP